MRFILRNIVLGAVLFSCLLLIVGCQRQSEIIFEQIDALSIGHSSLRFEAISSDGQTALFSKGHQEVLIYDRRKKDFRALDILQKKEAAHSNYAFSKNGRFVAAFITDSPDGYQNGTRIEKSINSGKTNIFIFDIQTGERHSVSNTQAWKSHLLSDFVVNAYANTKELAWLDLQISDDGSVVAYSCGISTAFEYHHSTWGTIFTIDTGSKKQTSTYLISSKSIGSATKGREVFPYVLSGDGSLIVTKNFVIKRGSNIVQNLDFDVSPSTVDYEGEVYTGDRFVSAPQKNKNFSTTPYLVNLSNDEKGEVGSVLVGTEEKTYHYPQISRNGKWIAFQSRKELPNSSANNQQNNSARFKTYIANIQSGETILIDDNNLFEGESIYLREHDIGVYELYAGSLISDDGKTIGITSKNAEGEKMFFFATLR